MPNTPKKYLAVLPWFPGFYESILDSYIDSEIENEIESTGQDWETVDKRCNYSAARLAMWQAWVKRFETESKLEMEPESMSSPREYNFTTDRVFVLLPEASLKKLKPLRSSDEFRHILKEWFTPRPGFIPHYDNYPEAPEWQRPVEQWDHNELSALIAAYVTKIDSFDVDDLNEHHSVYEAANHVWDSIPEPKTEAA